MNDVQRAFERGAASRNDEVRGLKAIVTTCDAEIAALKQDLHDFKCNDEAMGVLTKFGAPTHEGIIELKPYQRVQALGMMLDRRKDSELQRQLDSLREEYEKEKLTRFSYQDIVMVVCNRLDNLLGRGLKGNRLITVAEKDAIDQAFKELAGKLDVSAQPSRKWLKKMADEEDKCPSVSARNPDAETLINVAAEGAAQRILADGDYDDDATLVATAYLGEVVEAKRLGEQWQDTYAAAMAASCHDVELHCTCVGTLQEQIRRLERKLKTANSKLKTAKSQAKSQLKAAKSQLKAAKSEIAAWRAESLGD